jgi:site-specific DNA recombinase
MTKKTVAYIRVSTAKQLDGAGPDQQRAAISAWALAGGTTPDTEFTFMTDAESGDVEDRPAILQLKAMAAKGELQEIVVDRLDRLARDSLVSELLYRYFHSRGVRIVAVSQFFDNSDNGIAMRQMLAVFAQLDKAQRITHLKQCRKAKVARAGSFGGGGTAYGYASAGNAKLELVPGETRLVARAFELHRLGNNLSQIARLLLGEGFRTRKGTQIAPVQVQRILKHEAQYRGQATFHDVKLEAGVAPTQPAVLK